jgi:hypothetical protein
VHSIPQCFFHAEESSHRPTQHWTQEARTFLIGALLFSVSEQADYPLPQSHRHQRPARFFSVRQGRGIALRKWTSDVTLMYV